MIACRLYADSGSSSKAKENSVSAISKLAYKSESIQSAIASAGGIPLLASVLIASTANVKEMSQAAQLCSLTANAVSQLAEGNLANKVSIAEAGAIPPLVLMLASPSAELQAQVIGSNDS
jgi:vacuolar protein 8